MTCSHCGAVGAALFRRQLPNGSLAVLCGRCKIRLDLAIRDLFARGVGKRLNYQQGVR
jgi:hypothetical protein